MQHTEFRLKQVDNKKGKYRISFKGHGGDSPVYADNKVEALNSLRHFLGMFLHRRKKCASCKEEVNTIKFAKRLHKWAKK